MMSADIFWFLEASDHYVCMKEFGFILLLTEKLVNTWVVDTWVVEESSVYSANSYLAPVEALFRWQIEDIV